jgi:heavy metal sensor kinase
MFDSVRTLLTLWYVGVLALVIMAFAALTYFFTVGVLNRDMNARLEEMSRNFIVALKAEAADEEEERDSEQVLVETTNEFRFRDYQFAVLTTEGRLVASTADFEIPAENVNQTPGFEDLSIRDGKFRVFISPLGEAQNHYRLLVFHSLSGQIAFENQLAKIFLVSAPLVILIAGLGGSFLAKKALAPIAEMGARAEQIGAKNLNERLPVKNERDELGRLAVVFNALLARLENAFEQQQRFMADASHELRTPLAIVRGESEVALAKANRPASDYQESLAIVADESRRMTKIVEDLFTLARADAGQTQTRFAPVYLDEIVAETFRSMNVLAQKKQIALNFSGSAEEMQMNGDERLLRRLFLNLLDNAVKYSRKGGEILVLCRTTGEIFRVEISDSGSGIAPADQPHIFNRFYRADKARSRQAETETSGAGLGLSIAQWIAEIHQGTIKLVSSGEEGSVFTVEFPAGDHSE